MRSMTGFGAASGRAGGVALSVEVRSVNQRFLDLKINMPREYARWESDIRSAVSDAVARGRVEVYVTRNAGNGSRGVELREEVAEAYLAAALKLKKRFRLPGEIGIEAFLDRNDIFRAVEAIADAPAEIAEVKKLLERALVAHARERAREGSHLRRDMAGRARNLTALAKKLEKRARGHRERMRSRLEKRVGDLLGKTAVEPSRLVQEAALLAERADVTEEIVRLRAHVESLGALLKSSDPVAKRVDFLLQEFIRELNTIGSKAADLEITELVLEGKAEVEKVREQIQNVE